MILRRAASRFRSQAPGVSSWHGFSTGRHYDPQWLGHGPLVAHDEHLLEPGAGFAPHRHAGVAVVTWVLSGSLRSPDVLLPGTVQVLRTGDGVEHSEHAGPGGARFVQVWLLDDAPASVVRVDVPGRAADPVTRHAAAGVHVGAAALHVLRDPGPLPAAPLVHVWVAAGAADLDGVALGPGDAALLTGGGQALVPAEGAEVLVWALPTRA